MLRERFIEYLKIERRYSPRTVALYRKYIDDFYNFVVPLSDADNKNERADRSERENEREFMTSLMVRSFIAATLESGLSSRTINLKLSALSSYSNFLVKHGFIESNPVKRVKKPKQSKRLPEFHTTSAIDNYIGKSMDKDDIIASRDRIMVLILYSTGIRRAELANLRIGDWDIGRSLFRVIGKGDKMREVPVPDYLHNELIQYIELFKDYYPNNDDKFLFLTDAGKPIYLSFVNKVVKRELSGVEGLTGKRSPHTLRHSLATHLLNNGADLNSIKEVLGHSSLAATQVYTHNSFEQLKKVFLTAHPRAKK